MTKLLITTLFITLSFQDSFAQSCQGFFSIPEENRDQMALIASNLSKLQSKGPQAMFESLKRAVSNPIGDIPRKFQVDPFGRSAAHASDPYLYWLEGQKWEWEKGAPAMQFEQIFESINSERIGWFHEYLFHSYKGTLFFNRGYDQVNFLYALAHRIESTNQRIALAQEDVSPYIEVNENGEFVAKRAGGQMALKKLFVGKDLKRKITLYRAVEYPERDLWFAIRDIVATNDPKIQMLALEKYINSIKDELWNRAYKDKPINNDTYESYRKLLLYQLEARGGKPFSDLFATDFASLKQAIVSQNRARIEEEIKNILLVSSGKHAGIFTADRYFGRSTPKTWNDQNDHSVLSFAGNHILVFEVDAETILNKDVYAGLTSGFLEFAFLTPEARLTLAKSLAGYKYWFPKEEGIHIHDTHPTHYIRFDEKDPQ